MHHRTLSILMDCVFLVHIESILDNPILIEILICIQLKRYNPPFQQNSPAAFWFVANREFWVAVGAVSERFPTPT